MHAKMAEEKQFKILKKVPVRDGRTHYRVRCGCGAITTIQAWRGCKKCWKCGKILRIEAYLHGS